MLTNRSPRWMAFRAVQKRSVKDHGVEVCPGGVESGGLGIGDAVELRHSVQVRDRSDAHLAGVPAEQAAIHGVSLPVEELLVLVQKVRDGNAQAVVVQGDFGKRRLGGLDGRLGGGLLGQDSGGLFRLRREGGGRGLRLPGGRTGAEGAQRRRQHDVSAYGAQGGEKRR